MKLVIQKIRSGEFGYGLLLTATLLTMIVLTGGVWLDKAEARAAARRVADLRCLAENIYHEARGEPLVGQYAVAEVTMNRVASHDFPDSVCEVVHSRGAFSWTYNGDPAVPYGYEWRRAQAVASTVYDNLEAPLVNGALYYHAIYVSPEWAATRRQVALIGQHLFYL
jgi:spore germination cell wall hydrolase CwlJ-like protein